MTSNSKSHLEFTAVYGLNQVKKIEHFGKLMLSGRFANSDSQADAKVGDTDLPTP